jgi:hypothetical protein
MSSQCICDETMAADVVKIVGPTNKWGHIYTSLRLVAFAPVAQAQASILRWCALSMSFSMNQRFNLLL